MKLSDNQFKLLKEIKEANGEFEVVYWGGKIFAGADGRTLNGLKSRKLIERVDESFTLYHRYAITEKGLELLEEKEGK